MASHPHQILPPSPLLTGSTIEGAGGRKEGPRPTGFGCMGTLGRPNRPPHASPRGRPLGPSGTPHAPLPVKLRPPLVWKSMDGGRPAGTVCSLTSGGGGPAAASSLSAPCAHHTWDGMGWERSWGWVRFFRLRRLYSAVLPGLRNRNIRFQKKSRHPGRSNRAFQSVLVGSLRSFLYLCSLSAQ